jgi:glutamate-ammonia-ligase adenylyltransferase
MDADYFATFRPEDMAIHIRMAKSLSEEQPIQTRITPGERDEFEIAIAGFEYPGLFSILCGLLSAFALDIRSGDIYSFAKGAPPSKVVDIFRVARISGEPFDDAKQQEFRNELHTFARLLAEASIQEARMRLYRFLTERIERLNEPLSGLSAPVKLTFDNRTSTDWTVMEVQSDDTFAFLYAVSNALSLKGINIGRVKIRSEANQTRDRFFIVDPWGNKIKRGPEQERLSLSVRTIKQFTRFITEAPDPAKAMHHFDQFLDRLVEIGEDKFSDRTLSILSRSEGMSRLAQLLGSSDDLWDNFLQIHFTELLPMIEVDSNPPDKPALQRELHAALRRATGEKQRTVLNTFKDRQLFLIDVEHLLKPNATLLEFSRSLTDLAEAVLDEALRIGIARLTARSGKTKSRNLPGSFAIFGLGKFGGREMGYASDLELLFVHDGDSEFFEALAKQIVGFIETREKGMFHIDMRLRPHGDAGPWSTSFEQFAKYYSNDGGAEPFERQALIKLRWFAGDADLGRRVQEHRDRFTYGGQAWDWENALHLRGRQMEELVKPGQVNVKYSAGGIIDIEYAVQYLQLLNGGEHPEIRVPTTLEALEHLRRMQIVREPDYRLLHSSYLFLRKVIDALRIVRGNASDLVLPGESTDEFKSLARRLGYSERDRAKGAAHLADDIREFMEKTHAYFTARFEIQ